MNPADWGQLGVGVAAIGGLVYVARTLRHVMDDVLDFLGNHMSKNTDALKSISETTATLAERVRAVHEEVTRPKRDDKA